MEERVSPNTCRLIVFVRAPRAGMVKTRLAASIGAEQALAAYKLFVQKLFTSLAALSGVELCHDPADAADEVRPWLRPGWRLRAQGSGDLGNRMLGAFAEAFSEGADRVVLIGSDCPEITAQDIEQAWAALAQCDVVLGPASDGGYWLIGLRQAQPALFDGMRWSHGDVLEETLARAKRANLGVILLRELTDIDTEQDWREFIRAQTLDHR